MPCNCFVDNNLSIHFGEDKSKSTLLCSKHKIKNSEPLNIQYNDIKIINILKSHTYFVSLMKPSHENP